MAANTRWVQFDISAEGAAGDGDNGCKGTQGYSIATASVGDVFNIGSTTNRLHLSIGGVAAPYITLYSGSLLDARFVARDITDKLKALGKGTEDYDKAICKWENDGDYGNHLVIYPGELGAGSQVVVTSGTNDAKDTLGWTTKDENGGGAGAYTFNGDVTVSGTPYYGLFAETYKVVMSCDEHAVRGIGAASQDVGNTYAGTMTTGGMANPASDISYVISIDVTNGTVMGGGTGNVPTMTWTSTGSADDSAVETELLYPYTWYNVGVNGLMVKFTDATFVTASPAWTIQTYQPTHVEGGNASAAVGIAQYAYSSDRGDMSSSPTTTVSGSFTSLGSRGITIRFDPIGADLLGAGDEFYVICAGPYPGSPANYNISSLNYGNVTVSTESAVKCVMFEIESGAVQMSTVKFGLQSHGTFAHHDTGNSDTYFRFGTVGVGEPSGPVGTEGIEWYPNIVAADIDSDVPPAYLYATEDNLSVVSTADASESVGSDGLVADPMWLNIRLGAAETGANSGINFRCYFDYS